MRRDDQSRRTPTATARSIRAIPPSRLARTYELADRLQGEPARLGDLGVRVRGPAVLRRLPRSRHQRHRQAGPQRLPHARADARRSPRGREQRRRCHWTRCATPACAIGPTSTRSPRRSDHAIAVLVWNYHDDDVPAPAADVDLLVEGVPRKAVEVTHDRVDATHSNAYEAWKRMGSPQAPTRAQFQDLERAGTAAAARTAPQGESRGRPRPPDVHAAAPGGLVDSIGVVATEEHGKTQKQHSTDKHR